MKAVIYYQCKHKSTAIGSHLCFSSPFSVALLFIILMVLRRRRDAGGQVGVARAPLLHKERPQGRYYGIACDAEPVYAGW